VAPVAVGTTEHREAAPSPAKFPQGLRVVVAPRWRFDRRGGSSYHRHPEGLIVSKAVEKVISLPVDLVAEADAIARKKTRH
jgi:hypothetical protein